MLHCSSNELLLFKESFLRLNVSCTCKGIRAVKRQKVVEMRDNVLLGMSIVFSKISVVKKKMDPFAMSFSNENHHL